MSEKKATKKRLSKPKKGRSLNKIYAGVTLLAVLLVVTLIVALNSVNKNTPQVHTTPQIVQNTHENKATPVTKSAPTVKKEYERRKYPLKFDEDENLSQIFANSKKKDEFSVPKEKKQEHKNTEKEPVKAVTEQKSEQNDTKNLLANLPSAIAQSSVKKDKNETAIFEANVSSKTELNASVAPILQKDENKTLPKASSTPLKTQHDQGLLAGKSEKPELKPQKPEPKKQGKQSKRQEFSPAPYVPTKKFSGKPKLVIIIDDVATYEHASMIRSTGLKLTPSIFPMTKDHPNTPNIARGFEFHMIHLPMQAKHFDHPEIGTLNTNDSFESILKRIRKIRADFPRAVYMNNHTGSKFTSDYDAMDKAYRAFISEKFIFMDSKTIGHTVVAEVARKYSQPYISRDIFLDDDPSRSGVRRQLVNAVELAKKRSYAIAIGHPKKNTIDIIKESKDTILRDVDVVYLKEIL